MENQVNPQQVLNEMIEDLQLRIKETHLRFDSVDANDTTGQIHQMQQITKLTAQLETLLKFKRCMGW